MICGGWSGNSSANGQDQDLLEKYAKAVVERQLNRKFKTVVAVQSRSQLVAGMNYTIKGKFDDICVIVALHEPISGDTYVTGIKHGEDVTENSDF